jgi:biotin transporter BioY
MKTLLFVVGWCLLFVLCWPLLSLPFRLVSITFEALFVFLKAVLFLPARLLGYRDGSARRTT